MRQYGIDTHDLMREGANLRDEVNLIHGPYTVGIRAPGPQRNPAKIPMHRP